MAKLMKRYNLFLPEDMINDLTAFARQQEVSASSVIRYAVRDFLKSHRANPISGHAVNETAPPAPLNG